MKANISRIVRVMTDVNLESCTAIHCEGTLIAAAYSTPAATNIAFAAGVPRKWTNAKATSDDAAGSAA